MSPRTTIRNMQRRPGKPLRTPVVWAVAFGPAAVASILLSLLEVGPPWLPWVLILPLPFFVASGLQLVAAGRAEDAEDETVCRAAALPPLVAGILISLGLVAILALGG